jgi:4-carboxymuconolactone decarboxylase
VPHDASVHRDAPRIPPVDFDLSADRLREFWKAAAPPDLDGLSHFNLVRTLAQYPDLLARYLTFGLHLRRSSTLSARLRTIVSLKTAALCGSTYEWSKHAQHATKGQMLNPAQIEATWSGADDPTWSELERHVLSAVDQLCTRRSIADDTWAALAEQLDTNQLMDLILTVGNYVMLSMFIDALRIQDEGA